MTGSEVASRSEAQTAILRVQLLGQFRVTLGDVAVPDGSWRLRKARTLVKLLALAPGHRMHRDQVAQALWPDRDSAAAANNLHQVLHVARRQLDGDGGGRRRIPLVDGVLALCPDDPIWIDIDEFAACARAALRSGDANAAEAAATLYVGELLPDDRYEDWAEPTRRELARLHGELAALRSGAFLEHAASAASRPARARGDGGLPTELTSFVGREGDLEEVRLLLRRSPLVSLVGPAGCGKTRLAVEVAARERLRHPDGEWFVDLGSVEKPTLVADAIAGALRIRVPHGTDAADALLAGLERLDVLIILDNCEHLVQACAEVVDAALRSCPDVGFLATSREALRVAGEVVWRVPSLALPNVAVADPGTLGRVAAVRLFVDRASAVRPGFSITAGNAQDIARICQRLDGLPLAIELAAARVAVMSPSAIAQRLQRSFAFLHGGPRAAVTRQQTLEAALAWSHRLLSPEEAVLLRRLGVFAAAFGVEDAEAVCAGQGLEPRAVLDLLLLLVERSLVMADELTGDPGYRMLAVVRHDARQRLRAAGESDVVRNRHARWFCRVAERAGASPSIGMSRLDRSEHDLRAALDWLLAHDPAAALRLVDTLGDWWLLRGRLAEGHRWLRAALDHVDDTTPGLAGTLLGALGFPGRLGPVDQALQMAEHSVALFRAEGDAASASLGVHMQGIMQWLSGDPGRAVAAMDEAIAEARRSGSRLAEANAVHGHALVVMAQSVSDARSKLERTLELLAGTDRGGREQFLVSAYGHLPVTDDEGTPVRLVFEESNCTFRRVDAATARSYVAMNLARVARLEGDLAGAEILLDDALARFRAAGDQVGSAHALVSHGRLATFAGHHDRADRRLREGLAIRQDLGDVRGVLIAAGLRGELAMAAGDLDAATSLLRQALSLAERAGDRPPMMFLHWALARLDRGAGETEAAREHLAASLVVVDTLVSLGPKGWALAALAELDLDAGDLARAAARLGEARALLDTAKDQWGLARCAALDRRLRAG